MKPSLGRIVHYALSEQDAAAINKRREDSRAHPEVGLSETGVVIHVGNQVFVGDRYPMVIVRVWNELPGAVNGQVLLDGNDTFWVTSTTPADDDDQRGRYFWPTRD